MNTSLVLIDRETSAYKYAFALCVLNLDMNNIEIRRFLNLPSGKSVDASLMNMYIDEAIALLH